MSEYKGGRNLTNISFELYCVEIENIPYYNFLSDEEYEEVYERYEKYIGVEKL